MDQDIDSTAWLREFAENRSETAFARLVQQHLNLVYSVALRRCGGRTGLAQDVCQTVFIDLARKARALPADQVVAGWLYQHACFVAATLLRTENRRQRREETAMQHQALTDQTDWSRLTPLLDDALLELASRDRDSLVLRYLEQRPLVEVGARLGLSENAARMRVARALDKLRVKLAKRGVTSTSTALAIALAGPAVTAAPATLASTVTTAALAAGVGTASIFGFLSLMTTTKLKVAVSAAIILAVGVPLSLQQRTAGRLRAENAFLSERLTLALSDAEMALTASRQASDELAQLREGQAELLRLRGELARGRQLAPSTNAPVVATPAAPTDPFVATRWHTQAAVGLQQTLATAAWAWKDQAAVLLVKPVADPAPGQPAVQFESTIVDAPLEVLQRYGLAVGESDSPSVFSEEVTTRMLEALTRDGVRLTKTEPTTPGEEGFVYVGFTEDDHDQTISFKLAPELLADQRMNLAITAERRALNPVEQQILREPEAAARHELRRQLESKPNDVSDDRIGSQ